MDYRFWETFVPNGDGLETWVPKKISILKPIGLSHATRTTKRHAHFKTNRDLGNILEFGESREVLWVR